MNVKRALERQLVWLASMKQSNGYGGMVAHYWKNCLNYAGQASDWRYEGLIHGYLELFEKTLQPEFMELAIESGDFVVASQCKNGAFSNSAFEDNPNYCSGNLVHEAAVDLGLLQLGLPKLGNWVEENKTWRFEEAAKKNFDWLEYNFLNDCDQFMQTRYKDFMANKHNSNFLVPNKTATMIEVLLDLDRKDLAIRNAEVILDYQMENSGIWQSDDKTKMITFYNARCVPALIKLHKITNDDRYLNSAINIGYFILQMENKNGGFNFGYVKQGNEWIKTTFPIFVAGGAEIIRALKMLSEYEPRFKPKKKNYEFILDNQLRSGGFKTSIGMALKNTEETKCGEESVMDILPVVGWNDKVLRLLASELKEGTTLDLDKQFEAGLLCSGYYAESKDEMIITVDGKRYSHNKQEPYSNYNVSKKLGYGIGKVVNESGLRNKYTAKIGKMLKVK